MCINTYGGYICVCLPEQSELCGPNLEGEKSLIYIAVLCGKACNSHLCDGSAHSSGCVVNGSNAMAAFCFDTALHLYAV